VDARNKSGHDEYRGKDTGIPMFSLPLPPVIGHRGAAAHAPENTLASFRAAAALGCRMVEFDVRLSADGVPVVFHDDTLERTADGAGPVGQRSLAALKRLDAGSWFAPAFAGETIPTLAEVLALCAGLGLAVNIEVKPDAGRERDTALAAMAAAGAVWPSGAPLPLVSSFHAACLAAAAEAAPEWPRGLLVGALPADWRTRAEALGCAAIHADQGQLGDADVALVRAAGLLVLAYTVNDAAHAESLWRAGVAAVFADAPDRVMRTS
jgi:glycerophosphoryl diester phosphodiesterase